MIAAAVSAAAAAANLPGAIIHPHPPHPRTCIWSRFSLEETQKNVHVREEAALVDQTIKQKRGENNKSVNEKVALT